ncbi:MAG: sigma-70 family RNA polymerase sigma factor [Shinella sp.]|nr:sigma-70 family RNA polymerase sigma factor [Shinella sp.]
MTDTPLSERLQKDVVELIPALRAFARTFHRSPIDAEDLVQETLLKALSNLDKFEDGTRLKSWMFTIMRNTFCTRIRLSTREMPGEKECVGLNITIAPGQEWSVRFREFEEAMRRLPPNFREVIDEIAIGGESYEAAAARHRCAVGTIKSRLNRARQHLANELAWNAGDAIDKELP